MTLIETGAAKFIRLNFILSWLSIKNENIIGIYKLYYARSLENIKLVENNPFFQFQKGQEYIYYLQWVECEEFEAV
jgi:dTDP-D-glucose 4,6-dehydratase